MYKTNYLLDSFIVDKTQYLVFTHDEILANKARKLILDNSQKELNEEWVKFEKSDIKLANTNFVQNAKPEIVEIEYKKWKDSIIRLQLIENKMALFLGIETFNPEWNK